MKESLTGPDASPTKRVLTSTERYILLSSALVIYRLYEPIYVCVLVYIKFCLKIFLY